MGSIPALPYGAAATGPAPPASGVGAPGEAPRPRAPARPASGVGPPGNARPGRNGTRWAPTATGPTPGPPPPCGIQNVLCRLRWDTSAPKRPGPGSPPTALRVG